MTKADMLVLANERLRAALQQIADFGDPWEIMAEPEEFGGTDDGAETVCMVYENMQSIAQAALRATKDREAGR